MSPASDPSSSNHLSPRGGGGGRAPWAQVVRGEPEAISAGPPSPPRPAMISHPEPSDHSPPHVENAASSSMPPPPPLESPDQGSNGNAAARGKKPAWNMPSNGFNEAGPVMGADSWPPLSESTRASPKLSSSDSLKAVSDGSVSATMKPNHRNPNSTLNHVAHVRQKSNPNSNSVRHGGGSGSSGASTNGGPPTPLSPPSSAETAQIIPDKQSGPEPSPTDHPNKGNGNCDHGLRSNGFTPKQHGSGDYHGGHGGNRRGNGGGGSHHGAYRSRRDHERGGYDWNPPRGFSGRDAHMILPPQQQRGHPRPFLRQPPPAPAPFVSRPPPQVRPFLSPMGFAEIPPAVYYIPANPPLESLRNMPFVAHRAPLHAIPPPMFVTAEDHQRALLLKQIEYYFSSDNLCKDIYLRQKMDDQGWVPISLIAGFNRVKQLTNNIPYILDTIQGSDIVEVQGEKVRRRTDWMNWILPSPGASSPATSNYDSLAARMHNVELGEGAANHDSLRAQTRMEEVLSSSASGKQNDLSHVGEPNGVGNGQ